MKYKRHQEARITALLQWHFLLSNIAGYSLAKGDSIYFWDIQERERAIKAEKERKNPKISWQKKLPSRLAPAAF